MSAPVWSRIWELVHSRWGSDKDSPGYDKGQWQDLQHHLEVIQAPPRREELLCPEDTCGHLDCLTWWNTQALKAMTRHLRRELEDYDRIEAELDKEEPPL